MYAICRKKLNIKELFLIGKVLIKCFFKLFTSRALLFFSNKLIICLE